MAKQIAFDIIARDRASKTFSKIGGAAKLLGVVGLGGIVTNAVATEAAFGKTMNLLQAGSGASGKEMDKLRKLAIKMGADTQFSAGGAAEAMLELSRGGMKPATIQGGALAGTLTLAAAGQLELGEAANIAVKSMGQFNLKGKDMKGVAAALAGGANASSASVRDMAQALAQGGLAANSVGFSLQETSAVLAAFSNAGLEGSDAGTSLKTMLDRLQPATKAAHGAMAELGVITEDGRNKFIKANGEFKSAAQIAGILAKGTAKMTEAEKKRIITQAFGSDAQRAATVFAKEGAKGIKGLLKATSDQTAAQKMANASMKGSGGALEKMSGSLETASLAIGEMLAPAVVFLSDMVADAANAFVKFTPKLKAAGKFVKDNETTFKALGVTIAAVMLVTKLHTAAMAVQAAGGLLPLLKATKLVSSATKAYAAVQWILNAAMAANPIALVVIAIAALVAGLIIAYKKSETFRRIVDGALNVVKKAFLALAIVGVKSFRLLLNAALTGFSGILKAAELGMGWIPGIGGKIKKAKEAFDNFKDKTVANLIKVEEALQNTKDKIGAIKAPKPVKLTVETGAALGAVIGLQSKINKLRGKTIPIYIKYLTTNKGPKTSTDLYGTSLPRMAHGGIVRARPGGTAVVVGEGGHDEAVVPLTGPHAPRGGGPVINITVNGALDPNAVGKQIQQVLLKLKRTSGGTLGLS